ncbi:hypothetical protein AGMMS49546_39710 [Spirochaetia bacterium]|nr:hypothetical protein AGMMS49546_39710 [Spirochaetia bacterium]
MSSEQLETSKTDILDFITGRKLELTKNHICPGYAIIIGISIPLKLPYSSLILRSPRNKAITINAMKGPTNLIDKKANFKPFNLGRSNPDEESIFVTFIPAEDVIFTFTMKGGVTKSTGITDLTAEENTKERTSCLHS